MAATSPSEYGEKANDTKHSTTSNDAQSAEKGSNRSKVKDVYTWVCTGLLLVNYFLAQYDKFILYVCSVQTHQTSQG